MICPPKGHSVLADERHPRHRLLYTVLYTWFDGMKDPPRLAVGVVGEAGRVGPLPRARQVRYGECKDSEIEASDPSNDMLS